MNRRRFLAGLLAGAGTLLIPGSAEAGKDGLLHTDGWTVYLNHDRVKDYFGFDGGYKILPVNGAIIPRSTSSIVDIEGTEYIKFRMVPGQDETTYLVLLESLYFIPTGSEFLHTRMKSHKYPDGRVYAEYPLEEHQASNLCKQARTFRSFGANVPTFVYTNDKNDGFYTRGVVMVSSGAFRDEYFESQGLMTQFHELCHALFATLDKRDLFSVAGVYSDFLNDEELKVWGRCMVHEIHPRSPFRVLDESTHSEIGPQTFKLYSIGHPYDSPSELFASTLTTIRFFPESFVEEYMNLDRKTAAMVENALGVVLAAIESKNPDEKTLKTLLPNYNGLKLLAA